MRMYQRLGTPADSFVVSVSMRMSIAVDLPQERIMVADIVRDRAGVTLQGRRHDIGEG